MTHIPSDDDYLPVTDAEVQAALIEEYGPQAWCLEAKASFTLPKGFFRKISQKDA